jgi:hypothetical protein
METEIYGQPQYDVLEAYYETAKTLESWSELQDMARQSMMPLSPNDTANRDRLQSIITAVDMLLARYREYREETNEILNEVEDVLNELLK